MVPHCSSPRFDIILLLPHRPYYNVKPAMNMRSSLSDTYAHSRQAHDATVGGVATLQSDNLPPPNGFYSPTASERQALR